MQNAEQGKGTIWSRIQRTGGKAKDELSIEYSKHEFNDIEVDPETDPELYKFVEHVKASGPRFNDYAPEQLDLFLDRIYELRKNYLDNTSGQAV